jgi:ABC-type dipeptide/oligopeptide/nickel transport system ATPase component
MSGTGQSDTLLSARISIQYGDRPPVLDDVKLNINRGEVLGLVGQSGSGKSTLAMSILGLLQGKRIHVQGSILFEDFDLLKLSERDLRQLRGRKISLVLQSPLSSLNPALRIRTQLKEAWRAHVSGIGADCERMVRAALESVSLPSDDEFQRKFPSQMSVGQAQRVLIAMAVLHHPALLIADEATSALDVITQSEILGLFRELNQKTGMSLLYISHDLSSVAAICDRIAILSQGRIVETGTIEQIFGNPQHDYTRRLVAAIPKIPTSNPEPKGRAAGASTK